MDSTEERHLLEAISKHSTAILSKQRDDQSKEKKKSAWEDILTHMITKCAYQATIEQLKKKCANIQDRVKEKIDNSSKTGGGPYQRLSENDRIALDIIGKDNPKLKKVPGAVNSKTSQKRELVSTKVAYQYLYDATEFHLAIQYSTYSISN